MPNRYLIHFRLNHSKKLTAVNHIENLLQTVLGAALHAEVVKDKQRIAAKAGNVLVPVLEAGEIGRASCRERV